MSKRFQQYPKLTTFSLMICTMITGCASQSSSTKKDLDLIAAKEQITRIEEKIIELETRFGALNEKFNLLNSDRPESAKAESKIDVVRVQAPAAKNAAIPHPTKEQTHFADSFHHDEATDRYREAKILFETRKFADAILEFSEFIKNNPRHVLASNAQYQIGICYLQQKEYKIAEEELTRVLIDHPNSNAVPDALAALITVSDALGKSSKTAYYREKLESFFPNSPQAHSVPKSTEASKPVAAESEKSDVEKPALPTPPTAPITEMNSAETNGEKPSVVKP
jgi:TolA-binding protein